MGSIAVINFISRQKTHTRQGLKALLDYCSRNAKTTYNGIRLVTGINCVAQSAYNEMINTKLRYKKADGRMYYHLLQADFSRRGNTANADRISGYASTASGADSDGDLDLSGELPITGWESERGILEEALFGRGTNQNQPEETNLGFSYPDDSLNHLGSDSAYLAAEVINIIDNDTHIEDCTTMKKPRHEHKNTLGGM